MNLYKALKRIVPKTIKSAKMANYTSMRVGGPSMLVPINSTKELIMVVDFLRSKRQQYRVIGKGTNIIFGSKGYDGVVLQLQGSFRDIEIEDNIIKAYSAVSINEVITFAKEYGYGGIEKMYGIPGTIGGGVYMNAGAYDVSLGDYVVGVLVYYNDKFDYWDNSMMKFGYRYSCLMEYQDVIVVRVDIALVKREANEIKQTMMDILQKRKNKHPLNMPSAGSVFKRTDGIIVSRLLDEMGLKGTTVGGASISNKHAGFIVNNGNATSQDIKNLIQYIKNEVYKQKSIQLEEEVIFIGDD